MHDVLVAVGAWAVAVISAGGYLGIVGLMAIESACLPLPSEVIMPFAGYLVSTGRFSLWAVATAGALGCNVGSAIAYSVGVHGGRRFIARYGSYILLDQHEMDAAERLFARYGNVMVFVARLLPGIRTFIALPAGIARMPLVPFHLYTFAGSWPFCFVLAYVGKVLGERWNNDPSLHAWMGRLEGAVVAAGALLLIGYAVFRVRRSRAA